MLVSGGKEGGRRWLNFSKVEEENWVLSGLWIALSLRTTKGWKKEENGCGFIRGWVKAERAVDLNPLARG